MKTKVTSEVCAFTSKKILAVLLTVLVIGARAQVLHTVYPNVTDPNINIFTSSPHYCYAPANSNSKLLVFFAGSGSSPNGAQRFMETAQQQGFHVLGLMYVNSPTGTGNCNAIPNPETYLDSFCNETLFGVNVSVLAAVNYSNSAENRILKALQYLDSNYPLEGWNQFYNGSNVKWEKVTSAGHSQGGDHAAFLGKYKGLDRVICVSAPRELCFSAITLWGTFTTPVSKYQFFTHTLDAFTTQQITITNMGVTQPYVDVQTDTDTTHWKEYLVTSYPCESSMAHKITMSDSHTPMDGNIPHFKNVWIHLLTNVAIRYYKDEDGDGYGNPSDYTYTNTVDYIPDSTDCNDQDNAIHPNASEMCNSVDDNCNGAIDDNTLTASIIPTGSTTLCGGTPATLVANTGPGLSYQWLKNGVAIAGGTSQSYSIVKSATYACNVSNNCGTVTSNNVIITVNPAPTATVTPLGNLDICSTGSVVLEANTGAGYFYRWMKGSADISGATAKDYVASAKGTYKLIVTNGNGCTKKSEAILVTSTCRQSEGAETAENEMLSLFPNPSNGNFTLAMNLNDGSNNEEALIQINNPLGQQIYFRRVWITNGLLSEQIALSETAGLYYIRVVAGEKQFINQLILQN